MYINMKDGVVMWYTTSGRAVPAHKDTRSISKNGTLFYNNTEGNMAYNNLRSLNSSTMYNNVRSSSTTYDDTRTIIDVQRHMKYHKHTKTCETVARAARQHTTP